MRSPNPRTNSGIPELVRFRGHRGGIIPMHRALARLKFNFVELSSSIALVLAAVLACVRYLPYVTALWRVMFQLGLHFLPLQAGLATARYHFRGLHFEVPYLLLDPALPSLELWAATCVVTVVGFAFTFVLPSRLVAWSYLVRAVLFLQFSAVLYFAFFPAQFPQTPTEYLRGLTISGMALTTVIPALFFLTYYIFPFSFAKKVFLTLLTMLYLAVFLPLQVLLHALILQTSMLFMPALYLIFGIPLDVLIVVAFYSWGMSWKFKRQD